MFHSPGAIAFQVGPCRFVIRWYGILMASSIVVAFWLAHREAPREGLPADDIISVGPVVDPRWPRRRPPLRGDLQLGLLRRVPEKDHRRLGGRARHPRRAHRGAARRRAPGAALATCRSCGGSTWRRRSWAIGQAIGRWGNFFNEEAFGRPTDLPWKLYISPAHRPPGLPSSTTSTRRSSTSRCGTSRSSSCSWSGCGRVCVTGPARCSSATWDSTRSGRFLIERLRLDSFWVGAFRVPQLASLVGVLVAVAGLAWTRHRAARAVRRQRHAHLDRRLAARAGRLSVVTIGCEHRASRSVPVACTARCSTGHAGPRAGRGG